MSCTVKSLYDTLECFNWVFEFESDASHKYVMRYVITGLYLIII